MMEEASDTKNGLSHILSRRRRQKKDRDSSSNSIVSTGTESDGHRGVRDAIEGAIEKLKSDEHGEGTGNGLKKLMHKGMGSHRRRTRLEKEEDERDRRAAARGRNVAERGTLENESSSDLGRLDSERLAASRSWSGDGSSMLTYDSEPDA